MGGGGGGSCTAYAPPPTVVFCHIYSKNLKATNTLLFDTDAPMNKTSKISFTACQVTFLWVEKVGYALVG